MLEVLSGQAPPPNIAKLIFEKTEGNPFFVEEVFCRARRVTGRKRHLALPVALGTSGSG
jgi:hypothetical protein